MKVDQARWEHLEDLVMMVSQVDKEIGVNKDKLVNQDVLELLDDREHLVWMVNQAYQEMMVSRVSKGPEV